MSAPKFTSWAELENPFRSPHADALNELIVDVSREVARATDRIFRRALEAFLGDEPNDCLSDIVQHGHIEVRRFGKDTDGTYLMWKDEDGDHMLCWVGELRNTVEYGPDDYVKNMVYNLPYKIFV